MICVDAPVAAKWFLVEEHSPEARALIRTALQTTEPIIAPPLLRSLGGRLPFVRSIADWRPAEDDE